VSLRNSVSSVVAPVIASGANKLGPVSSFGAGFEAGLVSAFVSAVKAAIPVAI
jgi:hypothetical protein